MTLKEDQAEVLKQYPRTVTILQAVICCWCIHRGYLEGCKFGLLPLTIDKKMCPRMKGWGVFKREAIVVSGKRALDIDRSRQVKMKGV